jgi:hypothetical protein
VLRRASTIDGHDIGNLRLSEYRRSKDFRLTSDPFENALLWTHLDEKALVLGVWGVDGLLATMRLEMIRTAAHARWLFGGTHLSDGIWPSPILTAAATRADVAATGR